jgi:hypothetical protein
MKPILILMIFSLSFAMSYSQEKVTERSHYLFPEFTRGVVLMKTGIKNEALLNYNSLTEEMIFEEKGEKFTVGMMALELIDTVFIRDRKFCTLNNKFIELLYHSECDLYAEHKCRVNSPGKPDGYRGTSQTSAIPSSSSYYLGRNREKGNISELKMPDGFYELKLPDGYETKPYTYYWLKKNGELNRCISMRQLMKLYDDKEDLFKAYVKKHDIKFDNPESMVQFIKYLETN